MLESKNKRPVEGFSKFDVKLSTDRSSSSVVEVGSFASGASRVVCKGGIGRCDA